MTVVSVFGLRLVGAGAQLGLTAVLAWGLPRDALADVLLALLLANLLGALASAGTAQAILRDGSRCPSAIPGLLTSGLYRSTLTLIPVAMLLILVCASGIYPLSLFTALQIACLSLVSAICNLGTSACRAAGSTLRAVAISSALRPGLMLLSSTVLVTLGAEGPPILIAATLAHASCAALLLARIMPSRMARPLTGARDLWRAQTGWMLLSHSDALCAGAILGPDALAPYLAFRRVAALVAMAQDAVRMIHAPRVATASPGTQRSAIIRANRDFRLASLAMALPLSALGVAASFAGLTPYGHLLSSLSVAFAIPAVFGAPGLALAMTGAADRHARVFRVSLPFGAAACTLGAVNGPNLLALGFGATLGLHAGLAAWQVLQHTRKGPSSGGLPFGKVS